MLDRPIVVGTGAPSESAVDPGTSVLETAAPPRSSERVVAGHDRLDRRGHCRRSSCCSFSVRSSDWSSPVERAAVAALASDAELRASLLLTASTATIATLLGVLGATPLAYLLARRAFPRARDRRRR